MESITINNNTTSQPCGVNEVRLDISSRLVLKDMQVSLAYLGLYYSWRNITAANGNTFFQYIWIDGVTYNVNLPDGFYSISDLSNFLQSVMLKNKHVMFDVNSIPVYALQFEPNPTYYTCTFDMFPVVIPSNGSNPYNIPANLLGFVPQIVMPNTNLQYNLGLNPGTYPPTQHTTVESSYNAQNTPQITSITTVIVATNLIQNEFNRYKNIIYQFAPTTNYASYVTKEPLTPVFYNVIDSSYSSISLYFYDQNYNPILLLDRSITATLIFKQKDKK